MIPEIEYYLPSPPDQIFLTALQSHIFLKNIAKKNAYSNFQRNKTMRQGTSHMKIKCFQILILLPTKRMASRCGGEAVKNSSLFQGLTTQQWITALGKLKCTSRPWDHPWLTLHFLTHLQMLYSHFNPKPPHNSMRTQGHTMDFEQSAELSNVSSSTY